MGGLAVLAAKSQTFLTGAGSAKIPARRPHDAPERPSLPPLRCILRCKMLAIFVHFPRCLAAVTAVAQALQIAPVAELAPVSLVVDDVVNVRRPNAKPPLCTLAAKRLTQELHRPQITLPFVGLIHPAPGLCLGTAPVAARPVGVAVAVAHQHAASRMSARPQRLLAHGLSPPGKTKSLRRHKPLSRIMWRRHSGTGTRRYSRWTLSRRSCSKRSATAPWSRDSAGGPFPCRSTGKATIRSLLPVYHFFALIATLFTLFSASVTKKPLDYK